MDKPKEELKVIVQILGQATVRVVDAPKVIGLINKISQIIDTTKVLGAG